MKSTGNIKDIYDIIQEQKSIQICLVEEKSNVSSTYFKYKEICRSFAINWGYWKVQENFSKNETKQIKKKLFEHFVERFIISIEQVNLE